MLQFAKLGIQSFREGLQKTRIFVGLPYILFFVSVLVTRDTQSIYKPQNSYKSFIHNKDSLDQSKKERKPFALPFNHD